MFNVSSVARKLNWLRQLLSQSLSSGSLPFYFFFFSLFRLFRLRESRYCSTDIEEKDFHVSDYTARARVRVHKPAISHHPAENSRLGYIGWARNTK